MSEQFEVPRYLQEIKGLDTIDLNRPREIECPADEVINTSKGKKTYGCGDTFRRSIGSKNWECGSCREYISRPLLRELMEKSILDEIDPSRIREENEKVKVEKEEINDQETEIQEEQHRYEIDFSNITSIEELQQIVADIPEGAEVEVPDEILERLAQEVQEEETVTEEKKQKEEQQTKINPVYTSEVKDSSIFAPRREKDQKQEQQEPEPKPEPKKGMIDRFREVNEVASVASETVREVKQAAEETNAFGLGALIAEGVQLLRTKREKEEIEKMKLLGLNDGEENQSQEQQPRRPPRGW